VRSRWRSARRSSGIEQPRRRAAVLAAEDPPVAGLEDREPVRREAVAGRAAAPLGIDHAPPLQPRHGRAYGLLVEVEVAHQRDEVGHRDPAPEPPQEGAEERHQQ
jgi:hypothetical protein